MTALLEQWQEIKAVANDVVIARRRDDHASSRGRARSPAGLCARVSAAVRRVLARGEGFGRSEWLDESGRADRSGGTQGRRARCDGGSLNMAVSIRPASAADVQAMAQLISDKRTQLEHVRAGDVAAERSRGADDAVVLHAPGRFNPTSSRAWPRATGGSSGFIIGGLQDAPPVFSPGGKTVHHRRLRRARRRATRTRLRRRCWTR